MINLRSILADVKEAYYKFFDKPCREVVEANLNKLPDKIEVNWFRDGKYIIGEIKAENSEYTTQAISAEEFVEMVNDTLMAAYDVPKNCIPVLREMRKFTPSKEAFSDLNNAAIKKSSMSISRAKRLVAT